MNLQRRLCRHLLFSAAAAATLFGRDARSNPEPLIEEMVLVKAVPPAYPPFARAHRMEGVVALAAVVTAEGKVSNLKPVTGAPVFVPAAMSAVSQWTYRPARVDGVPVDAPTVIRVDFKLK